MKNFLAQRKEVVYIVQRNMSKPSYAIPAKNLYNLTILITVVSNAIQWRSTYLILKHFLQPFLFTVQIKYEKFKELRLDEDEVQALESFVRRSEDLNSATIQLQADTTTLASTPYYI